MPPLSVGGRHEAAGIPWRCDYCHVAAYRTRAAGREAADYRISRREHAFGLERLCHRFRAATARTWLDRGAHRRNRDSLAEGRGERFSEIAAEFVRDHVDIIVTAGGAVVAAKQATSTIPIIFALANDPVGIDLVASLARPGGNVTGLSAQATDLASKRLELLREFVTGIRRLAILGNAGYPAAVLEMGEVQETARKLGLDAAISEIRQAEDIAPAFEAFRGHVQALYVVADPLTGTNRVDINSLALAARLPTVHGIREYAQTGGLISYGPNIPDLFRRAAEYVDKILRGAKPADLPVEQPTKFELVINARTAKSLGLTVPQTLLALADEVIE
jgi:putative tryptophan/tyrosine transport system substrate-binding protein